VAKTTQQKIDIGIKMVDILAGLLAKATAQAKTKRGKKVHKAMLKLSEAIK